MCLTNEGEHHRNTASKAQCLPASQAGAQADCPSSSQQACQESPDISSPGTADPAERSCMQDGSAAVGTQLGPSAAVSPKHSKDFNSHTAGHQAAAARMHRCVLAERLVNKQKLTPSELAAAGKAKDHTSAIRSTELEQHQHIECMQPQNPLNQSSWAQSRAQPVLDGPKQSGQPAQQQHSSMQARQACSMQPRRTDRPVPRSQAGAPLLVRLGLFSGCLLLISSYKLHELSGCRSDGALQ